MTPLPLPLLAPWLGAETPQLSAAIARRALADVGICEEPPGSNRGLRIDHYNAQAGVGAGSYWCAAAAGAWWRDAGALVPPGYASCDRWLAWARATGRWSPTPVIGAAVLYGIGEDAQHIGVVVRLAPALLAVEGNTSLDGYSRNGELVTLKAVRAERRLGYVHPEPLG